MNVIKRFGPVVDVIKPLGEEI